MNIAVLTRHPVPLSFTTYLDNITRELTALGVEVMSYDNDAVPASADLVWDPFSGPHPSLRKAARPVVVTMLGDHGLGLLAREFYPGGWLKSAWLRIHTRVRLLLRWRTVGRRVAVVITVSDYARRTLERHLGLDPRRVVVIYHGVDQAVFKPDGPAQASSHSYFLHVSQYAPPWHHKKNVGRIIEAYTRLPGETRPQLILIIPGYPVAVNVEGVKIVRERLDHHALASLYRGAVALIFPSLHETFGLPIVEAMACGCPVITSNVTACPEVAGDAALLVNPWAVDEITTAMQRLTDDQGLREELRRRGLARARGFTWPRAAQEHLAVFRSVLAAAG